MTTTSDRKHKSSNHQSFLRAILALIFFFYFYYFQTPILTLAQHQLSGGLTTYSPLISSIVLTTILLILQGIITQIFKFRARYYLLSAIPSVSLAILLTAFTPYTNQVIIAFAAFLLSSFVVFAFLYKMLLSKKEKSSLHSPLSLWIAHLSFFTLISLSLGIASNSDDIQTHEVQMAICISNGECEQALRVGSLSQNTSHRLTTLRAFAMSKCGINISDSIFYYPIPAGGADNLLFSPSDSLYTILPFDSIYSLLGSRPFRGESKLKYLERVANKSLISGRNIVAIDYYLVSLLMEKDLDQFEIKLPNYYTISDSVPLPRHYEEARLLIDAMAGDTILDTHDSLQVLKYREFRHSEQTIGSITERRNVLKQKMGHTYWWYYYYGALQD